MLCCSLIATISNLIISSCNLSNFSNGLFPFVSCPWFLWHKRGSRLLLIVHLFVSLVPGELSCYWRDFLRTEICENWACQIWGGFVRSEGRRGECWPWKFVGWVSACLSCNRCSVHVLPHPSPPTRAQHLLPWAWNPVRHARCSNTLHSNAGSLYFLTLSVHSVLFLVPSNSLFSPFISLWPGYLQWLWKWSVNLSSHQSPQPRSGRVSPCNRKMMTGTFTCLEK